MHEKKHVSIAFGRDEDAVRFAGRSTSVSMPKYA